MESTHATLILWAKSHGTSEGEDMLRRTKEANIRDLVEKASQIEEIGHVLVVTDSHRVVGILRNSPPTVELLSDLETAPFGEIMRRVIERYGVGTFLYMGDGSGVFLEVDDLARIVRTALNSPDTVLVNNFYSTDFAAFGNDLNLKGLGQCRKDNDLGWVMGRVEGLKTHVLPSSLATRFDIDTPTDLMILKIQRPRGRHLSAVVAQLTMDLSPLFPVLDVLVRRDRAALLSGRVSLDAALFFDRETACHLRVHVEERGMETREGRGKVWSLLGQCIEKAGLTACFQTLSNHVDAALIDSRVLFRHFRLRTSRRDHYLSDLLQPAEITHPWVRMLTEAACRSPIPCLLGGHTLVSGGLYALAESAWARADAHLSRSAQEFQHPI